MYTKTLFFLIAFSAFLLLFGYMKYVRTKSKLERTVDVKSNDDTNRLAIRVARRTFISIVVIAMASWVFAAIIYFQRINISGIAYLNIQYIFLILAIGIGAYVYISFTWKQNKIIKSRQLEGSALTEKDMQQINAMRIAKKRLLLTLAILVVAVFLAWVGSILRHS